MSEFQSEQRKKTTDPVNWRTARELPRLRHPLGRALILGMRQGVGVTLARVRGDKPAFMWGLHASALPAWRSRNLDKNKPAQEFIFHLGIAAHLEILTA